MIAKFLRVVLLIGILLASGIRFSHASSQEVVFLELYTSQVGAPSERELKEELEEPTAISLEKWINRQARAEAKSEDLKVIQMFDGTWRTTDALSVKLWEDLQ